MILNAHEKYLMFPVHPLAAEKVVRISRDGQLLLDLTVRLDGLHPQSEVAIDIGRFGPGALDIACEPDMAFSVRQSADPAYPADLYREEWRPGTRFSAKRGWINDPNGLVYYRGVWHMFYQHNPASRDWGNMHWGHAVSTDLVHWEERDIALFPDADGTMFSGSAIVDTDNLLGLNTEAHEAMLLYYTCAGDTSVMSKGKPFTQCLAYSVDGGATFHKHPRNPLIPQICQGNRDPKVIRSPKGGYVLALYLDKNAYTLFHSDNLLDWTQIQTLDLPDDTECPDFYPLVVRQTAADPGASREAFGVHPSLVLGAKGTATGEPDVRWVLSGAADRYLVGTFDGTTYVSEGGSTRLHWGAHAYAAQSWSDVPADDGRRIRVSWNTADLPGTAFNRCMSTPCEMFLRKAGDKHLLCTLPVREVEALRTHTQTFADLAVTPATPWQLPLSGPLLDIACRITWQTDTAKADLSLFGATLHLDVAEGTVSLLGAKAPLPREAPGALDLRLMVDRTGVEAFLSGGSAWISQGHCADANLSRLDIQAGGDSVTVCDLRVSTLADIWTEAARKD